MALAKPASISNNAFKSAKWDEITAGRNLKRQMCQHSRFFANGTQSLSSVCLT